MKKITLNGKCKVCEIFEVSIVGRMIKLIFPKKLGGLVFQS